MGSDYRFLYWDDLGDSQQHVDNQCQKHAEQQDKDLLEDRLLDAEWIEKEEEYNRRMDIIGQNGNTGEQYFEYFNDHPSSAQIWDDEEERDIE